MQVVKPFISLSILLMLPFMAYAQSPFTLGISGGLIETHTTVTSPDKSIKPFFNRGYGYTLGALVEYKVAGPLSIRVHPSIERMTLRKATHPQDKDRGIHTVSSSQVVVPVGLSADWGRVRTGISARYAYLFNQKLTVGDNTRGFKSFLEHQKGIQGDIEFEATKKIMVGFSYLRSFSPMWDLEYRDNEGAPIDYTGFLHQLSLRVYYLI